MPLRGKYKATGSKTRKVLDKIFENPKAKAKTTPKKKKPVMASYSKGKADPDIGSKERDADLDAVVVKGKTGLPSRKKRKHPKRYNL
jgi:hypothetical protein